MRTVARHVTLLGMLLSFVCFAADPTEPTLSNEKVISIAKKAAEAEGIPLSKFDEPKLRFNADRREWFVFFNGKSVNGMRGVGDHFAITVNDSTGQTRLVPGI